jgi:hypothetical protein
MGQFAGPVIFYLLEILTTGQSAGQLSKIFSNSWGQFAIGPIAKPHYSLNPKKATVDHKNFSFCEQTMHKGLIDASCNWLQSTRKNRGQHNFLRKLRAKIQFPRALFSSLRSISSYNAHTILNNARRGRLKNIYLFSFTKTPSRPSRRVLPRASICNKEQGTY